MWSTVPALLLRCCSEAGSSCGAMTFAQRENGPGSAIGADASPWQPPASRTSRTGPRAPSHNTSGPKPQASRRSARKPLSVKGAASGTPPKPGGLAGRRCLPPACHRP